MLFGNKKIHERIYNEVEQFEQTHDVKVIYGANVGGISRGLQYKDSDYDTRFLYIHGDFPHKIYVPDTLPEKSLICRVYFDNAPFEWIPFWEFSSFIQFLNNPMIDAKFSVGLYNVVGWTFLSPYTYDPYGIQPKIWPLIQKVFHKDYFIAYHKKMMESFALHDETVAAKDYLYALHAALSINWADRHNEYAPVYTPTLLADEPHIFHEVCDLIHKYQKEAADMADADMGKRLHDTHFKVMTSHVPMIDDYLKATAKSLETFSVHPLTPEEKQRCACVIGEIYDIVQTTLYSEQSVRDVNC